MPNTVLGRYDDLGEYAGRDVVVVVPRPASVYTLAAIAVVNTITGQVQYSTVQYSTVQYTITGQVLGRVTLPRPEELESHPVPPSLGQNTQWWPDSTPPSRYIYISTIST